MTRSAVRICPAAPKNGLSHRDRPFFRISEYSNCRPPARSANSIIYGCFPPAGNIRQFESAQQLQRPVYRIAVIRFFVFVSPFELPGSEMTFECQTAEQAHPSRQQRAFFAQTRDRAAGSRACFRHSTVIHRVQRQQPRRSSRRTSTGGVCFIKQLETGRRSGRRPRGGTGRQASARRTPAPRSCRRPCGRRR